MVCFRFKSEPESQGKEDTNVQLWSSSSIFEMFASWKAPWSPCAGKHCLPVGKDGSALPFWWLDTTCVFGSFKRWRMLSKGEAFRRKQLPYLSCIHNLIDQPYFTEAWECQRILNSIRLKPLIVTVPMSRDTHFWSIYFIWDIQQICIFT